MRHRLTLLLLSLLPPSCQSSRLLPLPSPTETGQGDEAVLLDPSLSLQQRLAPCEPRAPPLRPQATPLGVAAVLSPLVSLQRPPNEQPLSCLPVPCAQPLQPPPPPPHAQLQSHASRPCGYGGPQRCWSHQRRHLTASSSGPRPPAQGCAASPWAVSYAHRPQRQQAPHHGERAAQRAARSR